MSQLLCCGWWRALLRLWWPWLRKSPAVYGSLLQQVQGLSSSVVPLMWTVTVIWLVKLNVELVWLDDYKLKSERRSFSQFTSTSIVNCCRCIVNTLVRHTGIRSGSCQYFDRLEFSLLVLNVNWRNADVTCCISELSLQVYIELGLHWDGWPSSDGYITLLCNPRTRATQPCIHSGSLNRVPTLVGWCKGRNVTPGGR